MKNTVQLVTALVCSVLLSACSSIGSYVISNPDIYLSEAEFIDAEPEEKGFSRHNFCSEESQKCLPYISAPAYQVADFPDGSSVFYNLHSTGNGVENTISHRLTPDTFNRFKGTAILLHGYGGNKEVMMASAIYFRAIGMQVIIPDLFGHGDSQEDFVFATQEHLLLEALLNNLAVTNSKQAPILVVGHSMGALPAARLLASEHITAGVLLAPMMRFDIAAEQYFAHKAPTLNNLLGDNLNDIVSHAMQDAEVTLPETDLLTSINTTDKPVLVINSDVDSVSPPSYFAAIENNAIEKVIFQGRSHSSLMVFDKQDTQLFEQWLTEHLCQ